MNTKTITTRKFLILFIVILVFGFTLKVEATSNFTIDSSCNIVFSAHDPNKDDIPLYGGTNAYYIASQITNDLGYVGTSYPPVLGYLALDDLTSFPHDPTGTLTGSGQMYLTLSDTNGNAYYVRASYVRTGSTCSDIIYDPYISSLNEITSFTPSYASTTSATTTPISFGGTATVDGIFFIGLKVTVSNTDRPLEAGTSTTSYFSGSGSVNVDYINGEGTYAGRLELIPAEGLSDPIGDHISQLLYITVGESGMVPLGEVIDLPYCAIGTFNLAKCLSSMVIPSSWGDITKIIQSTWNTIKWNFPLGYFTTFWEILKKTDKEPLPTIDLTVPEGIPGAGATLDLSLESISWLWNATTTFGTTEQKGKTFYSITEPYWNTFVYLGLFLYIISRILGTYVISQEMLTKQEMINKNKKNREKRK